MHCCSQVQSQSGSLIIEHNNGYDDDDDDDDDGQSMIYVMTMFTIIDGHGDGNNCDLDHLQDVDMSKGVDRDGDYDNDDKNDDTGDGQWW